MEVRTTETNVIGLLPSVPNHVGSTLQLGYSAAHRFLGSCHRSVIISYPNALDAIRVQVVMCANGRLDSDVARWRCSLSAVLF